MMIMSIFVVWMDAIPVNTKWFPFEFTAFFALPMTDKIPLANPDRSILETFDNPCPTRNYVIETTCPEFTSVCPKTGQPDFGTLTISYIPDKKCVELKSLKLYLQRFRNEGIFYEAVTNRILDDLVALLAPRQMTLRAAFTPRGGISTIVTAEYRSETGMK